MTQDPKTSRPPSGLKAIGITLLFTCLPMFLIAKSTTGHKTNAQHTHKPNAAQITLPKDFVWPNLHIDPNALLRERKAQPQANHDVRHGALLKHLLAAVRLANDHQFTTHPIPSQGLKDLEARVDHHLDALLTKTDISYFMSMGDAQFDMCKRGLTRVQRDIQEGKITLKQIKKDPPFDVYRDYREGCGNIMTMLHARHLINDKGAWSTPQSEHIATILHRYWWAFLAHKFRDARMLLTQNERIILIRWRIEDDHAYSLEERLGYLAKVHRTLPSYPIVYARALLDQRQGNTLKAIERLRDIQSKDTKNAATYAGWIQHIEQTMK